MVAVDSFDVVIAGGGLAGSTLGGVLARAGLGVLVVEKEPRFRDRIRGELTWPWGHAEALRAGLGDLLDQAAWVALPTLDVFQDGLRVDSVSWPAVSIDELPALGFSHPQLQEAALGWAAAQGAGVERPAKLVGLTDVPSPSVTVVQDGRVREYRARVVIGADGKQSAARRWVGAKTMVDPEHHRFGGVALSGVRSDPGAFGWISTPGTAVAWFARDDTSSRVYVRASADRIHETGINQSVTSFVSFAAGFMPEGVWSPPSKWGRSGSSPIAAPGRPASRRGEWCWLETQQAPWIPVKGLVHHCCSATCAN
jgi:2-polyprenyl-6-methoxyphenol hydroxylase-like FAD-dependent oxidoreductase